MSDRCSYQRPNLNTKVGSSPKLSRRAASKLETSQIDQAIASLKKARTCETEATLIANVTEAFRLTRDISRSRLL